MKGVRECTSGPENNAFRIPAVEPAGFKGTKEEPYGKRIESNQSRIDGNMGKMETTQGLSVSEDPGFESLPLKASN